MVQIPRSLPIAVTSALLFAAGALATYWSLAWSVDAGYEVSVSAPGGVTWILWVPHPGIPMTGTTTGSITVVGPVQTVYGTLLNLSGTGSGMVRFAVHTIGYGSDPFRVGPLINLTGREGQGPTRTYHVLRQSSDAAANLTVTGSLPFSATRLDATWGCGGGGFVGSPAEGWNALPWGFGDCVVSASPVPALILAALFVPAALLAVIAWGRREHRTT
ncbi:MAG TPA: hypothetical protein VJP06_00750 [Thermoplasmata archaeon]|nr:hypothetical protein [Thermoplasmata archaeon]